MAMALVSILRWNSALGAYERLDREIDLDEYPGHREYADPDFGPGLSAFPYGIDDSVPPVPGWPLRKLVDWPTEHHGEAPYLDTARPRSLGGRGRGSRPRSLGSGQRKRPTSRNREPPVDLSGHAWTWRWWRSPRPLASSKCASSSQLTERGCTRRIKCVEISSTTQDGTTPFRTIPGQQRRGRGAPSEGEGLGALGLDDRHELDESAYPKWTRKHPSGLCFRG
jgi:hypothetical protein